MAKDKKPKTAMNPVGIVKDAAGQTVAEIKPKYKMLPVDPQTYEGVLRLCAARGLNRRSQGLVVKSLVSAALERELPPNL